MWTSVEEDTKPRRTQYKVYSKSIKSIVEDNKNSNDDNNRDE